MFAKKTKSTSSKKPIKPDMKSGFAVLGIKGGVSVELLGTAQEFETALLLTPDTNEVYSDWLIVGATSASPFTI